jgi:hypothetical protein
MTAPAAPAACTAAPGAPPASGAPPGAPPDSAPFHSALEAEWARTATAEGHQQSDLQDPSSPGGEGSSSTNAPQPADERERVSSQLAGHRSLHIRARTAAGSIAAGLAPSASAGESGRSPVLVSAATGWVGSDSAARESSTAAQGASSAEAHPPTGAPTAGGDGGVPTRTDRLDAGGDAAARTGVVPGTGTETGTGDGATSIGDSPLTGEALPGGPGGSDPGTVISDSPRSWGGSDSRPSGFDSGRAESDSKAAPPLLHASVADATLGYASHAGGAGDGGNWSSGAGVHQPSGPEGLHAAGGPDVHDKLWVPDPASAPAGTGTSAGGIGGAAGAAGLVESAAGAQASATLGSDQSEIGQQAPLLDYGVGLQQAIETLHGTIQLAARQGLSQARIALEPEGLGEIRIHLTQTAQGLLARVSAETPIAAQALAAAHAELRQSLSSLGLNLARLHIGRHDQSAAQDGGTALGGGGHDGAAGSGGASSRGNRSGQAAAITASTDSPADPESAEDAQPAPAPSHGTLVDVLA